MQEQLAFYPLIQVHLRVRKGSVEFGPQIRLLLGRPGEPPPLDLPLNRYGYTEVVSLYMTMSPL